MIATLDLDAHPHNLSPYVQIGLITDLYIKSLLSMDSRKIRSFCEVCFAY
jgi:hypothetical protein